LPIGGVKEKLLAAHRFGLKTIIMSKDNEKDLADVPEEVREDLTIHTVEMIDEVCVSRSKTGKPMKSLKPSRSGAIIKHRRKSRGQSNKGKIAVKSENRLQL
jgi:ATP-dependent Lon protease